MSIEYRSERTNSEQRLKCDEEAEAIVRDMGIHGFGDCISFRRKNSDGSTFGSHWGLGNIGCFRELQPYTRLIDMPQQDVEKLATRVYELLFMESDEDKIYGVEPQIDRTEPKYQQILEELATLQRTEEELIVSGKIVFPSISAEELAWQGLW